MGERNSWLIAFVKWELIHSIMISWIQYTDIYMIHLNLINEITYIGDNELANSSTRNGYVVTFGTNKCVRDICWIRYPFWGRGMSIPLLGILFVTCTSMHIHTRPRDAKTWRQLTQFVNVFSIQHVPTITPHRMQWQCAMCSAQRSSWSISQ